VREVASGRVPHLEVVAHDGRRTRVRVKTRRKGSWHARVSDSAVTYVPPEVPTFWAFVDLSGVRPAFYIAPEEWVRRDIARAHADYLARHGGHRARNDASDHHAVQLARIESWRDRWDLLGV
jgi:hypothetical protein